MFLIEDIIDLAIQVEKNGEKVYRDAADRVSDPRLSSMLRRLADEEMKHAKWFDELRHTASKTAVDSKLEEMGKALLKEVLGDQSFSLKEANFSKIDKIKDLIHIAIEFEKDTVLFYNLIRTFVQDREALHHLQAIIEEENQHVKCLQDLLESGDER